MSINVEVIGGTLMVQHYVAEVYEPHHCRMVSLSDVQTPAGWRKIQVIWDLSVTALDSASCRYTNQVLSYPTPAFLETLEVAGISFEDAVADRLWSSLAAWRRQGPPVSESDRSRYRPVRGAEGSMRRNRIKNLIAGQGLPFENLCIESCLTALGFLPAFPAEHPRDRPDVT
jgi:hypothetical protein